MAFVSSSSNNATSSSASAVPDEKQLQLRLKAVASRSENHKCCDCSDPRPTWASLIMPPPDVIKDNKLGEILGAMCCYNCAGHHRSLGTHICRVKSCNLDTCTSKNNARTNKTRTRRKKEGCVCLDPRQIMTLPCETWFSFPCFFLLFIMFRVCM